MTEPNPQMPLGTELNPKTSGKVYPGNWVQFEDGRVRKYCRRTVDSIVLYSFETKEVSVPSKNSHFSEFIFCL